jgi:acetyl esterase/lipase
MTRSFLLLLSISLAAVTARPAEYSLFPDVIYGRKAGMALTYDVLRPDSAFNGAGIIHIVSGGWRSEYLPPDSVDFNYFPFLDRGYTVFIVRHGSAPLFKVPDAVDDIQSALDHIMTHAGSYSVDKHRLGIYGGSAGGQLALMAGTARDEDRPAAVVAFFPPTDLTRFPAFMAKMFPAMDFDAAMVPAVSPINYVSPGDSPTLLIHGDLDLIVPMKQSELMYDALEANGVPARLVLYGGMGHGNSYGGKGRYYEKGLAEMLGWFDAFLCPAMPDNVAESGN